MKYINGSTRSVLLALATVLLFSQLNSVYAQPTDLLSPAARAEVQKNNLAPAIAELTVIIGSSPTGERAYAERGALYFRQNEKAKALADAVQALILNPKNINALNLRASIKAANGDFEGAITDYSQVISLTPNRAFRAYVGRGDAYEKKNDSVNSLADYSKALEIDPRLVAAYVGRARIYQKQKDYKRAAAEYTLGLQYTPPADKESQASGLLARGRALQADGDYLNAANDFLQIAQSDNKSTGEASYLLGSILLEKKDYANAEKAFKRAVDVKYAPATDKLRETQALGQIGGLNNQIQDAISETKILNQYSQKLAALQSEVQPFVDKLLATAPNDVDSQTRNRAALRPKLQTVKDYINASLPELNKYNSQTGQNVRTTFSDVLKTVNPLMSKL